MSDVSDTEKAGPDSEYRATYDQPVDLIHTELHLKPDWQKKWMYGRALITLKPHFYPLDSLVLDAKGMTLHSISLSTNGWTQDSVPFTYDSLKIVIRPNRKFKRQDTLVVKIDYIARPDERLTSGSQAIQGDKGLYFINTDGKHPLKPRQLWTQGETEANSCWFPTIESPAQKMTQDIFLEVDSELVTLSNGLLVHTDYDGNAHKTDHWKQTLPAAPYLTMIAAGPFAVVKDRWNSLAVDYYLDPAYAPYAKKIFGETPAMIDYFSQVLGVPYPWEKFAQVVVHDFVSGAMENTTAVVHGTNMQQTDRERLDDDYTDFISHELFHQWFGDYVTCESWSNTTLNEGFATYGEYLWREHRYGRGNADEYAQDDLRTYLASSKEEDPSLIRFHYQDRDDLFDAVSYQKGGRVLHMLRQEVGDAAFFTAVHEYLASHAFATAEIHDLRRSFEQTTGLDLNWFFDQWYLHGGHPTLTITYKWNESDSIQEVTIEQTQNLEKNPLYRLPFSIDIYSDSGATRTKVYLEERKQTFRFPVPQRPRLVNVDATKSLVCSKKDLHSREDWRYMYDHGPLYLDRWEAVNALVKDYQAGTADAALIQKAWEDPSVTIRKLVLEYAGPLVKSDSLNTLRAMQRKVLEDSSAEVRTAALKALDKRFPYEAIRPTVLSAIAENSYDVVAQAFETLKKHKDSTLYDTAIRLSSDSSGKVMSALAGYWESDTVHDMTDFFWRGILISKSWNRFSIGKSYGKYLEHSSDTILEKGIDNLILYNEFTNARFARSSGVSALRNLRDSLAKKPEGSRGLDDAHWKVLNDWIDTFDKSNQEKSR